MSRKQAPHIVGMRPAVNAAGHRHDTVKPGVAVKEVAA